MDRNFEARTTTKYKLLPTRDEYSTQKREELPMPYKESDDKCCCGSWVKILFLFVLIIPVIILAAHHFYPKLIADKSFLVQIENFRPYANDQYVCVSHYLKEDETYFVTKFETSDKNAAAHHMLLYACEKPSFEHDKIWSCGMMGDAKPAAGQKKLTMGSICGKGEQEIIFAEAMQAGSYQVPNNVSFKLGNDAKFKYLTLQIHYSNVDRFKNDPNLTDNSGLKLTLAPQPTKYTAHVMLIAYHNGFIPKRTNVTNLDRLCTVVAPNEKITMKPFAFRTHAHALSKLITGHVIRQNNKSDWTLFARKSPLLEQMFYPTLKQVTINNLDQIAARCSYKNPTDHDVYIGGTKEDEMCNLYIMYYTETGSPMWTRCQDTWQPYYAMKNLQPIFNSTTTLTPSEKEEIRKHKVQGEK